MGLSLIGPYLETEIVNDYEVIVKFSEPYAPFLDSVSEPYLFPYLPRLWNGRLRLGHAPVCGHRPLHV